ncbi:uncharacterized protein BO66DRAFT_473036 [Aspergillus aculeatinus CBS 121060]|uniref:Uncharacterized protein n=1 Tax=Aspergillus aculeatinus CBS 121060 TaxID=1448322 RepID=A0ACD1H2F8_9EURO|nr:hypothetical protein BO66DRAFT_473036 [Aspergillus aculeatinus CBS 121060]RAH67952.1 hypothetical protein BO66DRAFT_473036 [Aspergillus aculeatinus CBS 121060]
MTATSEPNDEYNLQEAWERVCHSFAQTTKVDLTTAPNYTIEEAVIDKTLAFVKVLGGIVAQGASMVFAPSSLCFNAIAYLIDTGAKFKRIFSSLAELFRKVCDVLDRMQIYMRLPSDRKDPSVRRPTRDPDRDSIETRQILVTETESRREPRPKQIHSLALILLTYGRYDDAIERLKLASSLMSENWEIEWDLAHTYALKKDYARAIRTLEATTERLAAESNQAPEGSSGKRCLLFLKQDVASWYEAAGHEDQALTMYKDLLDEHPGEFDPLNRLFASFHKRNDYESALHFLRVLEGAVDPTTELDRRTAAVRSLWLDDNLNNALFALASNTDVLDVVLASYRMAIAAAEAECEAQREALRNGEIESQDPWMGYEWERVLDVCPANAAVKDLSLICSRTESRLASAYYTEVQHNLDTGASYMIKLEKLARVATCEDLTDEFKRHGAQRLAHYHVLRGSMERAQDTLRPFLKADLALLSDNDPLNDWEGYIRLAGHLRVVGMWDATVAAWSLVSPNPDYSDNPWKSRGPMDIFCEGGCGAHWTYADDLYVCKTCTGVHYDKACADELRAGTLAVEICSHDHELLHVPPYDPIAQARIGEGNVRVGGEVLSVKAWLERIRQEWGLELGG